MSLRRAFWLLPELAMLAACGDAPDTSPGVSRALGDHRSTTISDVRYALAFDIPATQEARVRGTVSIHFASSDASQPLVLDFTAPEGSVLEVHAGNTPVAFEHVNGHVVIPAAAFTAGENTVEITFLAGDGALNRNPAFLYTLFVPDRASSAFPSFDQPNLKAVYQLRLTIPADWTAVANGSVRVDERVDGRRTMTFAETRPISTYLFSFAAGDFQIETAERAGRTMNMYHRETDSARVARNRDAIFDLHETAVTWLEEYTGIPYPFEKFDFVAIPSFQYGGMEHVGAILYRAASLFHDEAATQNQKLGRASLIAHETAHMWFGNLVTMDWFDDVWMKEVFANFMAAKIVNPSFPEINHDLRFYLAHYASAYGIDRTEGANPIRQVLENQREAGSLYGAIIYQKAPIVMRHLERMIGEESFRDGLREYLMTHQYGNATWPDLIAILDARSERDLRTWSRVWVEAPGRPTIAAEPIESEGRITGISVTQSDPRGRGLLWNQETEILVRTEGGTESVPVTIEADQQIGLLATPGTAFGFALPGADGVSYAHFELDETSREVLLDAFATIDDPIHRAAAWSALSESMLAGDIAPASLLALVIRTVSDEPNELVSGRLLGSVSSMFWRYLEPERRAAFASDLEAILWRGVEEADGMSRRATFFNTYVSVAFTPVAIERLRRIWENETDLPGLPLSERNFTSIAQALAVREVLDWDRVLETQRNRISNPDRRARFTFVMPALSADSALRDSVFNSFAHPANRTHEPWVLEAMRFLNHPLRAPSAEHYIYPGLELVEEIQVTGDIFFPLRWLNSLLGGHRSKAAAVTVRRFLDERPRYPARLRGKVLQASDGLFRISGLARLDG